MSATERDGLLADEEPRIRRRSYSSNESRLSSGNVEGKIQHLIPVGTLKFLSTKYESLDYDICENKVHLDEEQTKGYQFYVKKMIARWFIFFFIGVITALIGVLINISVDSVTSIKFRLIKYYIDQCIKGKNCLHIPFFIWIGFNVAFIMIGSFLVTYIEPVASGSGIPQVKAYLNGIKMPRLVRFKTLLVKAIGVVTTLVGGLAAGKEGPMIHIGAVVAAGISQGKSTSIRTDFKVFKYFREDREKRDFVSGGAAAGVAAAFGAPVGGVLFSLEEGSSFWNQSLTWRTFFASTVATLTLNAILSTYYGHSGDLTYFGLLNFGHFDDLHYELFELFIFAFVGAIGGVTGALYTFFNYKLTVFRMRFVTGKLMKMCEACIVAAVSATVAFLLVFLVDDCQPLGADRTKTPVQMYCADGEYSAMAALWFQVSEASVSSLFHDEAGSQSLATLSLFAVVYFVLSMWTYGLSVSAGIFIPCLVTGAAYGRVIGVLIAKLVPSATWADPGKYALIGAAAHLGGVVRMTISLTVILIEATGNINFALPLMITLMTAKWVGDFFSEGFYDIHIQLAGIPLLSWEPPPFSSNIFASEVMSYPPVAFHPIEKVSVIVDTLFSRSYNGFPVVDHTHESEDSVGGKLRGLILRSQLIVLLEQKTYVEKRNSRSSLSIRAFRNAYPRYSEIKDIYISEEEMGYTIDLRPYMNPAPYTVQLYSSLPRVYCLFRALGLRHIVVVNDSNEIVGMITRKDLARYRVWKHFGRIGVEELQISDRLAE